MHGVQFSDNLLLVEGIPLSSTSRAGVQHRQSSMHHRHQSPPPAILQLIGGAGPPLHRWGGCGHPISEHTSHYCSRPWGGTHIYELCLCWDVEIFACWAWDIGTLVWDRLPSRARGISGMSEGEARDSRSSLDTNEVSDDCSASS
jgi:hypothetical protein